MNLYIYSDESGVFDKEHNDFFVFAGIICVDNLEKEIISRMYSNAEKTIRKNKGVESSFELKASKITNSEKDKLFRSLNKIHKFAVVIKQKDVLDRIYKSKKDKQRYLDYAYKIAIKRAFEALIKDEIIDSKTVERLYFNVDAHTTATNGRYELKEALEQEFKYGTYNLEYSIHYSPIFENLMEVELEYCNSASKLLVRAADIIANKVYYCVTNSKKSKLDAIKNLFILNLPK
jgi:hypothetical protein